MRAEVAVAAGAPVGFQRDGEALSFSCLRRGRLGASHYDRRYR